MSERLETMRSTVGLRSVGGPARDRTADRPAVDHAATDHAVVGGDARILAFPRPRYPHDDGPAAA